MSRDTFRNAFRGSADSLGHCRHVSMALFLSKHCLEDLHSLGSFEILFLKLKLKKDIGGNNLKTIRDNDNLFPNCALGTIDI